MNVLTIKHILTSTITKTGLSEEPQWLNISNTLPEASMLKIQGGHLSREDKLLLRSLVRYTLDFLLKDRDHHLRNLTVTVGPPNARQRKDQYRAEMWSDNHPDGSKTIQIWLRDSRINKRAKTFLKRFEKIGMDLCHELVHAKQYVTGELVELDAGYKFLGKKYGSPDDKDIFAYFEQPFEIEAYGRERGLWVRFELYWKELERGNEQF